MNSNETYTYFQVMGKYQGTFEPLFGSYVREDCEYELDAERESWRGEGYKNLSIVSRQVSAAPDPEVYK